MSNVETVWKGTFTTDLPRQLFFSSVELAGKIMITLPVTRQKRLS
ncbi:hypothetical protein [Methylobacter tundripaludum]|nr:hypothetical protein [Methylobacter tundripaludum]